MIPSCLKSIYSFLALSVALFSHSSVFCSSSFLLYILPFPSFFHFIDHFLCNPWLSSSPLDSSNQISHSIQHTFLDIVPLHFDIPFHNRLYHVFLLVYLALTVTELVTSSDPILVQLFGTLMIFFSLVQIFPT